MALEKLSPATMSFYAPRFEVEINNSRLAADISKAIMDVTIDEKLDEGASFHFTVNDEFDMAKQQFKWLDHPLFEVGNTVSIKIGYGGDMQEMVIGQDQQPRAELLFRGPADDRHNWPGPFIRRHEACNAGEVFYRSPTAK